MINCREVSAIRNSAVWESMRKGNCGPGSYLRPVRNCFLCSPVKLRRGVIMPLEADSQNRAVAGALFQYICF
jgi:hypothetical protein